MHKPHMLPHYQHLSSEWSPETSSEPTLSHPFYLQSIFYRRLHFSFCRLCSLDKCTTTHTCSWHSLQDGFWAKKWISALENSLAILFMWHNVFWQFLSPIIFPYHSIPTEPPFLPTNPFLLSWFSLCNPYNLFRVTWAWEGGYLLSIIIYWNMDNSSMVQPLRKMIPFSIATINFH